MSEDWKQITYAPNYEVSKRVEARGGYDLMPEQNTKPVNKYLPPRTRQMGPKSIGSSAKLENASPDGGFLGWLDNVLSD